MLQTNSRILNMRYQLKNTIRDRLTYCLEWKQNIEVYFANKSISEKANEEYYKSKPFLKLIVNFYYIPYQVSTNQVFGNNPSLGEFKFVNAIVQIPVIEVTSIFPTGLFYKFNILSAGNRDFSSWKKAYNCGSK